MHCFSITSLAFLCANFFLFHLFLFLSSLSLAELNEFENFVNLETIDIYNVLTLRTDVPDEMKASGGDGEKSVVERIQDWAKESPLGKADKEKYVEVKTKNNLI